MRLLRYVWLFVTLFTACQPEKSAEEQRSTAENRPIPYNLAQPAETYDLPNDLQEISGLSYYKPGRLACVQDELGVVFIYDYQKKRVVDEHVLSRKGDYEGVEFVDGRLYVLRSDGEIYHIEPTDGDIKIIGGSPQGRHIKIDLKGKNDVEGLGYDPQLGALLLAVKDLPNGSDKPIYFYDLKNKALWRGPVLKQDALHALAGEGATSSEDVKPSGIAVHPKTGEYYVLASGGSRLIVTNRNGKLLSSVALDATLLPQPEGICFLPDGTLFIASEGKPGRDRPGRLLRYVMAQ